MTLCLIEINYLSILFQINAVLNFYLSNNPEKKGFHKILSHKSIYENKKHY